MPPILPPLSRLLELKIQATFGPKSRLHFQLLCTEIDAFI